MGSEWKLNIMSYHVIYHVIYDVMSFLKHLEAGQVNEAPALSALGFSRLFRTASRFSWASVQLGRSSKDLSNSIWARRLGGTWRNMEEHGGPGNKNWNSKWCPNHKVRMSNLEYQEAGWSRGQRASSSTPSVVPHSKYFMTPWLTTNPTADLSPLFVGFICFLIWFYCILL